MHAWETRVVVGSVVVAFLPTLLLLGWTGWRRLRRVADPPSIGVQGATTSSVAKGVLHAARASAAERRLRVSLVIGQAGWAVWVGCLTSGLITLIPGGHRSGDLRILLESKLLSALGLCLLLLALLPTDARAIRTVCATVIILKTGASVGFISRTRDEDLNEVDFPFAALSFISAAALTPTLRCRGDRAMPPRPALRLLWIVIRFYLLGFGVLCAGLSIADFVQGGKINSAQSDDSELNSAEQLFAPISATALLIAVLATPRNRGRIHRRLGRLLGGRGTEAEEAAAVAALVGGSDSDAALDRASKLLRCLPASRLHAADLADGMTAAPPVAGPTLHARTVPAAMGQVTAFLSHSWSDEDKAPGAKHALVSRWAKRRQETTGIEPMLWLVALAHTHRTFPIVHTSVHIYTLGTTHTSPCATGQGVHRPEQYPAVACLLAHLPRGLPDAARRGRTHVLLEAVVRHGALHVRPE